METKLGCPVTRNEPPCTHMCGGGWPGTRMTGAQLRDAFERGILVIDRLGCGALQDQMKDYQRKRLKTRADPS